MAGDWPLSKKDREEMAETILDTAKSAPFGPSQMIALAAVLLAAEIEALIEKVAELRSYAK